MQQGSIQIGFETADVEGRISTPVTGNMSAGDALSRLLSGTGLTFRYLTSGSVVLEHAPQVADGTVQLGTLRVEGAGGRAGYGNEGEGWATETPYYTPAPTAHISAETIERYRGSSPADILRGTAGVMSGESRNSGSSVDVNIRGMQGFGRVVTTVDGAENSVTVYQGYQGVSNRTYVDPDFIAGIDVIKGSDAGAWGSAGSVSMRTIGAADVVEEGQSWGIRVRGGLGGNSSSPVTGNVAGNKYQTRQQRAVPSATGLDRPSFLEPTNGSASIVTGLRLDGLDLVAGYAWRERGNYHAGTNGGDGVWTEEVLNPANGNYVNGGYTNYRPGEEVLNTELETESWLVKAKASLDGGHSLQLGYTGFRSEGGDLLASRQSGASSQPTQQRLTAGTRLDTLTAQYRWNPAENDLVDLKANFYWTYLELRNAVRAGRALTGEKLGLGDSFRVGSDTDMWGLDITNNSNIGLGDGKLALTFGVSYRAEDTRGSRYSGPLEAWGTPRDGIRHEVAGFTKASLTPAGLDWLTLNAGLRYSHYWSRDRYDPYEEIQANVRPVGITKRDGALSPTFGITVEPFDGAQLYATYSDMVRAPSVFESVNAFNSAFGQEDLIPERSRNWEFGGNLLIGDLLSTQDSLMLKLNYFNWDVKNYISRVSGTDYSRILETINIDRARFSGFEFSGRYETGGFSADLSANYYTNIEFCRTEDTCASKTIYSDYATNHVPPEYTVSLSLEQKLFDEAVTLGGRVARVGPRAIGHGDVTGQGLMQFISVVQWKPHTLVDIFSEFRILDGVSTSLRVENLFDKFYVDPLGLITQPAPGRTFYATVTGNFGGGRRATAAVLDGQALHRQRESWTGIYGGLHGGYATGLTEGTTTVLIPGTAVADAVAAEESAHARFRAPTFGVHLGVNQQLPNRFVLGLEGDLSTVRSSIHQDAMNRAEWLNPQNDIVGVQAQTHYDREWMATMRTRLGYAISRNLMPYVTAGIALSEQAVSRDQYRWVNDGYAIGNEATRPDNVERVSGLQLGYTLGGGVEYALNNRFSIRAEYQYNDFGRKNLAFHNGRSGTGQDWTERVIDHYETLPPIFDPSMPLCADPTWAWACEPRPNQPVYRNVEHAGSVVNGRRAQNSSDIHAIRVGVSYRF